MAEFSITPEDLARLARLVEENGLSELRYEEGDLRVTLRTADYSRQSSTVVPVTALSASPEAFAALGEDTGEGDIEDSLLAAPSSHGAANQVRVDAPIMGVFYRRPSPDEPTFVEVGDEVEVGQVVGIIEAMKVFSEVPSEVAGRVVDIPAKHGALVQPGDPLIILESAGEAVS